MKRMTTERGTSVGNALRKTYRFMRARKAYITVLSCFVVFVATYLLILPALTLDQDEAAKKGGIDVPTQAEQIEQGDPEDTGTVQEAEADQEPESDQELESDQEEEITETPIDSDAKAGLTASGETYEIAVEYGEDAMIPEGAELKVKEISDSKDAYAEIQKKIDNGLEKGKEDIPSNPALFDISIMYDGQEIEPAEGSEVRVEVKLASGSMKGMYSDEDSPILINEKPVSEKKSEMDKEIQVLHLTQDDEIDVMKTEDKISDKEIVSSFKTDSFSNWLVYLDEDLTDINITTGDSLTLRPYSEWVWKQNAELEQYQGGQWIFPSSDWDSWTNGGNTYYRHKQTGTVFRSFPKNDGQLNENYTVVTSETITEGTFDLQTNKGKVIHVHVTPGDGNHKPNTVDGISGLKVNLFDYDVPNMPGQGSDTYDFTKSGSLDVQSNVATNPNNNNNINTGHDLKILGYGGSSYAQNSDGYDRFWINGYTQQYAQQGIVKDELSEDGYPELTPELNGNGERENPSLKYLFDPESKNHNVYAFPGADGLFQQDNQGFYYYNSNSNYAEYDQLTNRFILYEHTYSQNTGGSNGANAKPIGFFPFHKYDTVDTQPEMNFNSNLNHHFGMSMAVDFEIPKSRKATDQQGNKHDIIYEFSGDDDLWVFVDDELVLDIGGIHQPVTGKINFTTGEITVYGEEPITKSFSVGGHTLKMFYMERGGCDSNLSVKFNLPLVNAMGDFRVAKKSMVDDKTEPDRFLAGAVFGIWDTPDCSGEPYMTATSDSNGYVKFENVPVKQTGQKYYLKEIVPPDGYLLNTTIFTATAGEPDENDRCEFTITEGTSEVETMTQEPNYPIVRDSRPDPIDLSVHKQWENADGSKLTPDPSVTAQFEVKRNKTTVKASHEQTEGGTTLNLGWYRADGYNPRSQDIKTSYSFKPGTTATIHYTYNQGYNGTYDYKRYEYNGSETNLNNKSGTFQVTIPSSGVGNLFLYDSWQGGGLTEMYATGTPYVIQNQTEPEITTGPDDEYHGPVITLPTSTGKWEDTFRNLTVQETSGDYTYLYEYYIVEKTVPSGFEAVYLDGDGHPIANASGLATNESGSQTIVNRKLLDVPIEKHWADFLGDEYTWTASFQLEQMEVKVNDDDPDASDAIKNFTAIEGKTLTISKVQHPVPTFDGLPMYRVHSNGTLYRIIYSVSETAYTVKDENNTVVAHWSKSEGVTVGGSQYTPHFEQDAGENGDSIEDYKIILINAVQNLKFHKGIELGIQKEWQGDSSIANDEDAFATFVLKRHVHEEYRDYTDVPDDAEWVDVTLDTWGAGHHDKQQTIHVPKGTTLHIVGSIKGKTNANKIAFSQSSGQDPIELIQDNSGSEDKALFDITFTADQTKTISLTQGDNYVIGGRDGFFLSDTYGNKTSDQVDQNFSYEFTLNKANNWTENFDYLPQIVEQDVDPTERSQTVYVYSYYIEEVSSNPDDYTAMYRDSQGNVIGDIDNAIDVNSEITATNQKNSVNITIVKVEKAQPSKKLSGAVFTLRQIEDALPADGGTFATKTGTEEQTSSPTAEGTGQTSFTELGKGYYELKEQTPPAGYILTEDTTTYFKISGGQVSWLQMEQGKKPSEWSVKTKQTGDTVSFENGTFTVENVSGAVLPNSGGPGTTWIYLIGCLLFISCSILLVVRRRMEQ